MRLSRMYLANWPAPIHRCWDTCDSLDPGVSNPPLSHFGSSTHPHLQPNMKINRKIVGRLCQAYFPCPKNPTLRRLPNRNLYFKVPEEKKNDIKILVRVPDRPTFSKTAYMSPTSQHRILYRHCNCHGNMYLVQDTGCYPIERRLHVR